MAGFGCRDSHVGGIAARPPKIVIDPATSRNRPGLGASAVEGTRRCADVARRKGARAARKRAVILSRLQPRLVSGQKLLRTCRATTACATAIARRSTATCRHVPQDRAEGFGAEVSAASLSAPTCSRTVTTTPTISRRRRSRRLIRNDFAEAFKLCDLVVGPTTPDGGVQIRRPRPPTRCRCT